MKLKTPILAGLCALLVPLALNAAPEKDEHAGHDQEAAAHDADDHAGHDHDNPAPGPNKGKVFTNVEPHAEFFVTKDRKIQITFLDHDNKVVPVTGQSVKIICGSRSAPTQMTFEKKDNALRLDQAAPGRHAHPDRHADQDHPGRQIRHDALQPQSQPLPDLRGPRVLLHLPPRR